MKKVLIQGAFEILNWGHVKAFEFCKQHGDYLVVALNTDELLRSYKNREPILPWQQKKEIIESIKFVDEVVPASDFSPLELLRTHQIDVYALTDEWKHTKREEMIHMQRKGGGMIFPPRFEGVVSTTEIRNRIIAEDKRYQKTGEKPLKPGDYEPS